MKTISTHYPEFVKLLEFMRADNGEIFLDQIEGNLLTLTKEELEILAAGEHEEIKALLAKLQHNSAKALDIILNAAFDGV